MHLVTRLYHWLAFRRHYYIPSYELRHADRLRARHARLPG
jgi:hypothetical protein